MNAIVRGLVNYWLRKYREPSTWVPIVSALGAALHFNVSPDLQSAVDAVFAAVVGVLFVAINEHGGAAAADSVRESAPASTGTEPSGPDMQAGSWPGLRPASPVRRIGPDHGGD